jgi:NAD(P)H-hydrate epimerase
MSPRTLPTVNELPRALYSAAQVRELDRQAIERFGIPAAELMERAGRAVFEALRQRWPEQRRLHVLAGTGNNAGDGFVVARLAREAGLEATVLQLGDRARLRGDAADKAAAWSARGGAWLDFERLPRDPGVIVDALFGTGLERPVAGAWAAAVEPANASRVPRVAVDIPSGLHADTGAVLGCAVRADLTVTFIGLKQGLFTADGPDSAGEIRFDSLGVPAAVYASTIAGARRIDWRKQAGLLAPRRRNVHKGHFGHVVVVGGNRGMGGAARIAAEAALRTGAGRVSLATRPEHLGSVLAARPEVMVHAVEDAAEVDGLLRQASVVAIGPGLGRDDWARGLWERVLAAGRPLVVDADALHLLAQADVRRDDWVLTPHPGEAAALLGVCGAEIQADRFGVVARLQSRYGGSVVLKGCGSLVASATTAPPAVCSDGNPGMASGGMGDALTGVIAGLLAQGLDARDAAECGTCLHAAAGDAAAAAGGERGLLAGDLMSHLRRLANLAPTT